MPQMVRDLLEALATWFMGKGGDTEAVILLYPTSLNYKTMPQNPSVSGFYLRLEMVDCYVRQSWCSGYTG